MFPEDNAPVRTTKQIGLFKAVLPKMTAYDPNKPLMFRHIYQRPLDHFVPLIQASDELL